MYNISSIEPGSLVNVVFDTTMYQPLKRVRVRGVVDYTTAATMRDVMTEHKNIYSTLIQQPADNIRAAKFLLYADESGVVNVVADLWIRDVTVVVGLDVDFSIVLDNRQELDSLTRALAAYGFNDVKYNIRERT